VKQAKREEQSPIFKTRQIPLSPPLLKGEFSGDSSSVQFPTLAKGALPSPTFLKGGKGGLPNNEPILIASNGSLSGLLSPNTSLRSAGGGEAISQNGENVQVTATGTVGTTTFEGVEFIRVIHERACGERQL